MKDKYYYVTWDENKFRSCYSYWVIVIGRSVNEVKEVFVWNEQNYRRGTGKPHMFHVRVTKAAPDDLDSRSPGTIYHIGRTEN